jgi:metal-sulfur cluster biosynthetic enzyme
MSREKLASAVEEVLRTVIDPELGENVVDLGLIYRIAVEDGVARIEMTTTTRGCPAAGFLKHAVETAAWAVPGIHFAEVTLTYEPAWTPAMIRDGAAAGSRFR